MIVYRCDVCAKTKDAATAADQSWTCPPKGWLVRTGLVPSGRGKIGVHVTVCSAKCAKAYDRVEVEEVGFSWWPPSGADVPRAFPFKVRN